MIADHCVPVPIIPEFLYEIRHPNESFEALAIAASTTTPPPPCSSRSNNLEYPSEPSSTADTSEYLQVLM
jgi:hypothetical protein